MIEASNAPAVPGAKGEKPEPKPVPIKTPAPGRPSGDPRVRRPAACPGRSRRAGRKPSGKGFSGGGRGFRG